MSLNLPISVLVSIGLHPKSQRSRRAEQDAQAVELCLQLIEKYPQFIKLENLEAIHAGEYQESVLRNYLGMGLLDLSLLEQPAELDAIDTLVKHLKASPSRLIVTGSRAEQGEGSGACPIIIAEQLGWPLVSSVAEVVQLSEDKIEVLQALPRGQRRKVVLSLPCVIAVGKAAGVARQSAFGPASRGQINRIKSDIDQSSDETQQWQYSPAQKRSKRLKRIKAKTAADRFKAATAKVQSDGGKVMQAESVDEKAKAIYDVLVAEGVLKLAK